MLDVCRNCGRLAGLPSCMAFTKYGSICESCNLGNATQPPFKLSDDEYRLKVQLYKEVGSVLDA